MKKMKSTDKKGSPLFSVNENRLEFVKEQASKGPAKRVIIMKLNGIKASLWLHVATA